MFHWFSSRKNKETPPSPTGNGLQETPPIQAENGLQYVIEDGLLRDCKGQVAHWVVPAGISAIASLALSRQTKAGLVSVVIPEGIETIRANTFQDCPNLVSVTLPQSIRSIRTKAFANCVNLRDINFPEGIQDIEEDAFLNCPNLMLPMRVVQKKGSPAGFASAFKKIPDQTVFRQGVLVQGGFDTPHDLIVPLGVTAIGRGAFAFFHLRSVILPEGLQVIGEGAFALCDEMERIYLPSTLVEIGKEAFSCCSKLREINFPENIRFVGEDAFNQCSQIDIPRRIAHLMKRSQG